MNASAWQKKAARFAELMPGCWLHPSVRSWAESRCGAARGPWAAAFSGGADSLGLLLLLWAHWPDRRRQLVALHFNHRLRGRAADADERFCRSVCVALGVRLHVGHWKRVPPDASEEEARAARFAFFGERMRRIGASALWLGHHQNDIAETMLMRLARGSGTGGLAAPRPVQRLGGRVHLRPLLAVKKGAIVAAMRSAGIDWREDRTNAGEGHFRNRIRLRVLPAWQHAAGRDAVAGAALSRELLEEDDSALDAWLDELRPLRRGGVLELGVLKDRPRAIVRRALRRWLGVQPLAGALSRQGFEDLLAVVSAGRPDRRSLGRKGFAGVRGSQLRFEGVVARKRAGRK